MTERTVLIIDDNPTNLGVVADYLEDFEFEILTALDGRDGLAKARSINPEVILLDVMMPGIDGFETCRQLKLDETTKDIPVIFMTALAKEEDKIRGFEVGAADYITKPIHQQEVLIRLRTHLHLEDQRLAIKQAEKLLQQLLENVEETKTRASTELAQQLETSQKIISQTLELFAEVHKS
ncbi:response regulator [Anaerolineales bacterium HSG25]|nr:response regulator [Anaerolineales bacterium HSG25]